MLLLTEQGVTPEDRPRGRDACRPADGEPLELIPFNGPAKKALELTFREALRLGHNYIGTEHVLLALLESRGRRPAHCTGPASTRTAPKRTCTRCWHHSGGKD